MCLGYNISLIIILRGTYLCQKVIDSIDHLIVIAPRGIVLCGTKVLSGLQVGNIGKPTVIGLRECHIAREHIHIDIITLLPEVLSTGKVLSWACVGRTWFGQHHIETIELLLWLSS